MESQLFLILAAPFVGSFLGVVTDRLPEGRDIVLGRSACDACGRRLALRDLVPLLSWLAARGRCRHCGVALGPFLPAIELAALAIALWSVAVVPGWLAWPTAGLGWTLLALSEIDRRHMILPDALTLPLVAAGLAVAVRLPAPAAVDSVIGAIAGWLALLGLARAHAAVRGREGLGLGDAKLFAAAGAWLGWQGLPSVLLVAASTGLATAAVLMLSGRLGRGVAPIPFGPFLSLGLWLGWLYGPVALTA